MTPARIYLSLALVLSLAIGAVPAIAGDLDDDLRRVSDRIGEMTDQISEATANRSTLAADVVATKARIDEVLSGLSRVRDDLAALESSIREQRTALEIVRVDLSRRYDELTATRGRLEGAKADAIESARQAYMSAGPTTPEIAFSAKAVSEIAVGVEYMERLTRSSETAVVRYEELLGEEETELNEIEVLELLLADETARLEQDQSTLDGLHRLLQERSDELQAEFESQKELLAKVEAEIAHFEGELAGLETEQSSIKSVITAAAAKAEAATAAPRASRGGGVLAWPLPGPILSGFGPRVHPILGTTKMHNGLDLDGPSGQPITAAGSGTVILAGAKGGYGTTVMIDHGGGMVTLYAHQSSIAVSQGQKVSSGQVIGYVGSSGLSTGPHLHFEVRIGGDPADPLAYL